jgi:ABC-type sulfate transport system permease component
VTTAANRRGAVIFLAALLLFLCVFLILPLTALVRESVFMGGAFSGFASFRKFLETPGLTTAFAHTVTMDVTITGITLILVFALAFALTHTRFASRKAHRGGCKKFCVIGQSCYSKNRRTDNGRSQRHSRRVD